MLKSQRGKFEGISYFTISYSQKVVSEKSASRARKGLKAAFGRLFALSGRHEKQYFRAEINEKEEKRAFSDLFSPFFRPKQMTRTNRGTFSRAKKAASDCSLSTKKGSALVFRKHREGGKTDRKKSLDRFCEQKEKRRFGKIEQFLAFPRLFPHPSLPMPQEKRFFGQKKRRDSLPSQ